MHTLIKYVQEKSLYKKESTNFNTGDTITVFSEIKEGSKIRVQSFKGVVIKKKGEGYTATFSVRKISGDVGVERLFIISQPNIKKIEVNKKGKVRRSKIYYFSKLIGKKSCIKEKINSSLA
ncbi:MAG: 50S ribosomal protein L19 [Candidatus Walczuchella monophlebidarum]